MTVYRGWLEISEEGFAQRQVDRPPAHLVKELVQNAFDATEGLAAGEVRVTLNAGRKGRLLLTVTNSGPPLGDPRDLRTVFSTGKEESPTLRGRMGQGFKEILSIALRAEVRSGRWRVWFGYRGGEGLVHRVTRVERDGAGEDVPGTEVTMALPWLADAALDIVAYLYGVLVPPGRRLWVQGKEVPTRPAARVLAGRLRTEVFEAGRWTRRPRDGEVALVPVAEGEEPRVYEMGIPVQPAGWTVPYHADVRMRVPMNPRRDAVAAGYLRELYALALPALLPELQPGQLRDEWVSEAVTALPEETRAAVVTRALGPNAVRAVPTMGGRDYDADARELGYKPVDTGLLPSGLRGAARAVLRTSRDVEHTRRAAVEEAIDLKAAGAERFEPTPRERRVAEWLGWLAGFAAGRRDVRVEVVKDLVVDGRRCIAAWQAGGVLILNRRVSETWDHPAAPRTLGTVAHEAAHARAPHHGDDFRKAVEEAAGRLARAMFDHAEEIQARFPDMVGARRGTWA